MFTALKFSTWVGVYSFTDEDWSYPTIGVVRFEPKRFWSVKLLNRGTTG